MKCRKAGIPISLAEYDSSADCCSFSRAPESVKVYKTYQIIFNTSLLHAFHFYLDNLLLPITKIKKVILIGADHYNACVSFYIANVCVEKPL